MARQNANEIYSHDVNLHKRMSTDGNHEYPGVGHNCWDFAYANPDLYEWLMQQKGNGSSGGSARGTVTQRVHSVVVARAWTACRRTRVAGAESSTPRRGA